MQRTYSPEYYYFTAQITPQSLAAGVVSGPSVDALAVNSNLFNDAMSVMNVGPATGAPTSFAITGKLQHSVDNATWTDVVGISATAIVAGPTVLPGYSPNALHRYRRFTVTSVYVGGTAPANGISCVEFAGGKYRIPLA